MKKYLLRGFGLLGIFLFVPLFLFTFSNAQLVEKSAKNFIEWKLKNEVDAKINSIKLPESKTLEKLFGDKVKDLYQKTDEKLVELKQKLRDEAPTIMAIQIAKMADLNCECRGKWVEHLRASLHFEMASLEKAKEILANFVQGKYMEIVEKLTMEVRIFLGLNSLIFIFLFLMSFLKQQVIENLSLPSALMLFSTIICSYFYLFQQNWFYAILYNDYIGFGYLAYLLVVFAILCDIIFNKAKVTGEIINAIGSAF